MNAYLKIDHVEKTYQRGAASTNVLKDISLVIDKGDIARSLASKVVPLMEQGQCLPLIHEVFPLAEAAQAHALMESSKHIGKIMLKVQA